MNVVFLVWLGLGRGKGRGVDVCLLGMIYPHTRTHTHAGRSPSITLSLKPNTTTPKNALTEAGIPIDLSLAASPSSAAGGNSLEQDYAEFKQPDANGDDRISRKEVSACVWRQAGG